MKSRFLFYLIMLLVASGMLSAQDDVETSIFARPAYFNNRVYFKTKNAQSIDKKSNVFLSSSIENTLSNLNVKVRSIQAPYSNHFSKYGGQFQTSNYGIDRICEIIFEDSVNVFEISKYIAENSEVEYAEPVPMNYLLYTPNDPNIVLQWHLKDINVFNAWDIAKDKTAVVIGIVDSGTQWDHIDLEANAHTDKGWDFVGYFSGSSFQPDNDVRPWYSSNDHGTHVAGCAAAVVNNAKLGAGSSHNAKFIATKHSSDNPAYEGGIYEAYKGIMYCAERGAKVINCSWGGPGYSTANEEVIKEANSHGCLIFAAAGNENSDNDLVTSYPANYPGIISIGATKSDNKKADFSCYGYSTKIFAPGKDIFSTMPTAAKDGFYFMSGTSMAAPVATGVAAMVRSVFHEYDAKQAYHQIRSTLDPLSNNGDKKEYGKINAFKALSYNNTSGVVPGVAIESFEIPPFNSFTSYNDKKLKLKFVNHIGKTTNLSVKLTSLDNCIDFDGGAKSVTISVGSMNIKDTTNKEINVKVNKNAAISRGKLAVMVEYSDGSWKDFEMLYLPVNMPTVASISTGYFAAMSDRDGELVLADAHFYDDNNVFAITYLSGGQYNRLYYYPMMGNSGGANPVSIDNALQTTDKPVSCWRMNNNRGLILVTNRTNSKLAGIYRTTNFYSNGWTRTNLSETVINPLKLYFKDDMNGIILVDAEDKKWNTALTIDGGITWLKTPLNSIPEAMDGESSKIDGEGVCCGLENYFWFATNKGRIYRTADVTNSSTTWSVHKVADNIIIKSMAFGGKSGVDSGMIIFYKPSNDTCFIATTTNKGNQWTINPLHTIANGGKPVYIKSVPGSSIFAVVTDNNSVMLTNNLGETWKNANAKYMSGVKKIVARNSLVGANNNNRITIKTIGYSTQFNSTSASEILPYCAVTTTTITEPFFDVNRSITLQPPSIVSFGTKNLGKDTTRTVTITNTGNAVVNLSDYKIIPNNDNTSENEFVIMSRPSTVPKDGSSDVRIRFTPKTAGEKDARLWISNNTDSYPEIGLILRGTATFTEFAELTSNRKLIEYDSTYCGSFSTQLLQLKNTGNVNVTIDSIAFKTIGDSTKAGEFSYSISSGGSLPITLIPNQSQSVSVIFSPIYITAPEDQIVNKNATMFVYNGGVVSPIEVEINGISHNNDVGIIEQNANIFSPLVPNPTNDVCYSNIYLETPTKYKILLLTLNGEEIAVIKEGEGVGELPVEIKTNSFASGVYFVVLDINGKRYFNKLTINK